MNHVQDIIKTDPFALNILQHINGDLQDQPGTCSDYHKFSYVDNLLYRDGLLYIPDIPSRLKILQTHHDSPLAGHFGVPKTLEFIT